MPRCYEAGLQVTNAYLPRNGPTAEVYIYSLHFADAGMFGVTPPAAAPSLASRLRKRVTAIFLNSGDYLR